MGASGNLHGGTLLSASETEQVVSAIGEAERRTSAEIKVVVVRHCWTPLPRKARRIIRAHGLDRTAERNAVLILIAAANREFLIRGDRGIHDRVGQEFWDDVRDVMAEAFSQEGYERGLRDGIRLIGDKLADLFPLRGGDRDELSNEVLNVR